MITQVQIAYKNHLKRLFQWLFCVDGKFLAILMVIMQPAYDHEQGHTADYSAEPLRAILKEIRREQAAPLCNPCKQERQQQIQKENEPGVAHIIYCLGQSYRQPLYADKTDKEQRHPDQKHQQHSGLYGPHSRGDSPQPPTYVYGKAQQQPDKQQRNSFIHRL